MEYRLTIFIVHTERSQLISQKIIFLAGHIGQKVMKIPQENDSK